MTPKKMADAHWIWIKNLIRLIPGYSSYDLDLHEYLYKTAFIHSYKRWQADKGGDDE